MQHPWKCNQCGYIVRGDAPPAKCPSCEQECSFVDIACYTPDCGGPESGNIDPQLLRDTKSER